MFTHGAVVQDVSALELVINDNGDVVLVLVGAPPTTYSFFLVTLKVMFRRRGDNPHACMHCNLIIQFDCAI